MEIESYDDKISLLMYDMYWRDEYWGECPECGSTDRRKTYDKVIVCRGCGHYEKD